MTAADNLTEAADLARQAAEYESLTTQHTLMGRVFQYNQPPPHHAHLQGPRMGNRETRDSMRILEIHAEGLPRHVGPFAFRYQAEEWARNHIRTGSWSVIQPTHPNAAVTP